MYIVHNAWVCLLASWFISCLLPRAHPLIGFLWWNCIIAKLPCCHGCFFSMTWLFRFIWVTRSSVGSQTVKECEYMWIVEEKNGHTYCGTGCWLIDRFVVMFLKKIQHWRFKKIQKLIQWEAIQNDVFFPKRKVVFQPWIFRCELFVSGRVSKTQDKKRKYIPRNSAGDLFGMVSSRDPKSKGWNGDLQRLGIKRSRPESPGIFETSTSPKTNTLNNPSRLVNDKRVDESFSEIPCAVFFRWISPLGILGVYILVSCIPPGIHPIFTCAISFPFPWSALCRPIVRG